MRIHRAHGNRILLVAMVVVLPMPVLFWIVPRAQVRASTSRSVGDQREVPLLPVVFFDSASPDIPERYDLEPLANGSSSLSYRSLYDAYLRVLDVLAEQLLRTGDRIVLIGYEDRTDGYGECYLARARAERIKNYLVFDRGVTSRNIRVIQSNTSCVPPDLSRRHGRSACSEYRRVEILTGSGSPYPIMLRAPASSLLAHLVEGTTAIHFDAGSTYVTRTGRERLRTFVDSIPVGGQISLIGYADIRSSGRESANLARQRVKSVADYIGQMRPDCRIDIATRNTSGSLPYGLPDIDVPEIRFLSRVVIVRHVSKSAALRRQ